MKQIQIDRDTEFIILAGIRYGMGRRSYAPSLICDWVRNHWFEVPPGLRNLIRRDVLEEVDRARRCPDLLGSEIDRETWFKLEEWLKDRPAFDFEF